MVDDSSQQKVTGIKKKIPGFSPLSHPIYKTLWFATIGSNIGNAMHDVGALWLMTNLTSSPLMVALLQTSTALAMVLLSLFADGLADVVDRRRLLLITQGYMFVVAMTLGLLTIGELVTPTTLLLLTFMLGAESLRRLQMRARRDSTWKLLARNSSVAAGLWSWCPRSSYSDSGMKSSTNT